MYASGTLTRGMLKAQVTRTREGRVRVDLLVGKARYQHHSRPTLCSIFIFNAHTYDAYASATLARRVLVFFSKCSVPVLK